MVLFDTLVNMMKLLIIKLYTICRKWISALDTVTVRVMLRVGSSSANTETVTFTAVTYTQAGDDPTFLKAYLYIGQQVVKNISIFNGFGNAISQLLNQIFGYNSSTFFI